MSVWLRLRVSAQSVLALVIGGYAAHRGFKALLAGLSFVHDEHLPRGFVGFNVMALVVLVAAFAMMATLSAVFLFLRLLGSTFDLRPLAVGRGTFRVQVALKSGKRSRTIKRTIKVGKDGTLPRIAGSLAKATARCTVTLTVRKKAGSKWRKYATAKVVLAG